MKKNIIKLLLIAGFSITGLTLSAQAPPPPPSGGHGQGTDQPGGGAPLDGGLTLLIGMGAVWGGRKLYKAFKDSETEFLD